MALSSHAILGYFCSLVQDEIGRMGGVRHIVQALKHHVSNEEVVNMGVRALANLAYNHTRNQEVCFEQLIICWVLCLAPAPGTQGEHVCLHQKIKMKTDLPASGDGAEEEVRGSDGRVGGLRQLYRSNIGA